VNQDYLRWALTGGLFGWIFYALGRFFMGAWVARRGWIQNAADNLPMFRRWLWPLLVTGLVLESVHLFTADVSADAVFGQMELLRTLLHAVATPLIAAGYICAIVLLVPWSVVLSWLVRPFAPVGQMALTNYLTQSVAIILILTSVGPGLGLAGNAGVSTFPAAGGDLFHRADRHQLFLDEVLRLRPGRMAVAHPDLQQAAALYPHSAPDTTHLNQRERMMSKPSPEDDIRRIETLMQTYIEGGRTCESHAGSIRYELFYPGLK
jgi:hypothetical protein